VRLDYAPFTATSQWLSILSAQVKRAALIAFSAEAEAKTLGKTALCSDVRLRGCPCIPATGPVREQRQHQERNVNHGTHKMQHSIYAANNVTKDMCTLYDDRSVTGGLADSLSSHRLDRPCAHITQRATIADNYADGTTLSDYSTFHCQLHRRCQ
jgi:hypothetical protein